jgi:hypothetical protein
MTLADYGAPRSRKIIKDTVVGANAQPILNPRKKMFDKWSTLKELKRTGSASYEEHHVPIHDHTFPTREP